MLRIGARRAVLVTAVVCVTGSTATAAAAVSFSRTDYPVAEGYSSQCSTFHACNATSGDYPISVTDFNGDGHPDIAVSDSGFNNIHVLLGNGDGTFQMTADSPSCPGPANLLSGDFDGDGKVDLLVDCTGQNRIDVLPGDGKGGFGAQEFIGSSSSKCVGGTATSLGDTIGPMLLDNNSPSLYGGVGIHFGVVCNGIGGCIISKALLTSGQDQHCAGPLALAIAHFFHTSGCGDSVLSIDQNNQSVEITSIVGGPIGSNDPCGGAISMERPSGFGANNTTTSNAVATGDLNGDGVPDIVMAGQGSSGPGATGGVSVLLSNGTAGSETCPVCGFNANPTTYFNPGNVMRLAVADFNGDGHLDVAAAATDANEGFNGSTTPNEIDIYPGNGDGTLGAIEPFTVPGTQVNTNEFPYINVADVNGDGKPDIVVTSAYTGIVTVLLNTTPFPSTGGGSGSAAGGGGGVNPVTVIVGALKANHHIFYVGKLPPHFTRAIPTGTTISFSVNPAARVTFAFTRLLPGKRSGRRCVAPTPKLKHARSCTRRIKAGSLSFNATAGTHKLFFDGKLSNRRKLRPGHYELVVTAAASGSTSTPAKLRLTLLAPPRH